MTARLREAAAWLAILSCSAASAAASLWLLGTAPWSWFLAAATFFGTVRWLARGRKAASRG